MVLERKDYVNNLDILHLFVVCNLWLRLEQFFDLSNKVLFEAESDACFLVTMRIEVVMYIVKDCCWTLDTVLLDERLSVNLSGLSLQCLPNTLNLNGVLHAKIVKKLAWNLALHSEITSSDGIFVPLLKCQNIGGLLTSSYLFEVFYLS